MMSYDDFNEDLLKIHTDKKMVNFIKGMIVARKMRGLRKNKFAEMIDVTASYLVQVDLSIDPKKETKKISGQLMFAIAFKLGCTVDLLVFYGDNYDYYMDILESK